MAQKARERALAHERLAEEIERNALIIRCVVHDLSGPLTGLVAGLSMLSNEALPDKARELLQISQLSVERLQVQLRELPPSLSQDAPGAEKRALIRPGLPSAVACVRRAARLMVPNYAQKSVTLRCAILAPLHDPLRVVGESLRFERVLANLLENALRHSPAGSEVLVTLQVDGDFVVVSVEDRGPGVPVEFQERLFQRHASFSETRGKAGLGLFYCRTTVEQWGGSSGYAPRSGGGAHFWVRILRAVKLDPAPEPSHARSHR